MTGKQKNLEELLNHLIKLYNSQSMSEEFYAGYNYAICEIKKFGQLNNNQKLSPRRISSWEKK